MAKEKKDMAEGIIESVPMLSDLITLAEEHLVADVKITV